jgi:hypothetical protein
VSLVDQRQQRLGEAREVPVRDARLVAVGVAPCTSMELNTVAGS